MLNVPYTYGSDIKFLAFFNKVKKIIDSPSSTQIGVMLDSRTNYEYIKRICEYFPLVIFFVNNPYLGDNIASNILKDIGSSIYVSKDINSSKSCELIFDLSKETLSDKINRVCTNNYISLYIKKEFVEAEKIINSVKVRCANMVFDRMDIYNRELSFIEGLLLEDKVINGKKDILNVELDNYLAKKSLKLLFYNEF